MDHSHDSNLQQLHCIDTIVTIPSFVKESSIKTAEELPLNAYADSINSRYPCDSKSNTWLSWTYWNAAPRNEMDKKAESMITRKLGEFIEYWGIEKEANEVMDELEAYKDSLSDEKFAMVIDYEGETYKLFPVDSAHNIQKSANEFVSNRTNYPLEWRKTAASNLLENAKNEGVHFAEETTDYLQKTAGIGLGYKKDVLSRINRRIKLAHQETSRAKPLGDALLKTAELMFKNEVYCTTELMTKLASFIERFDNETGLDKYYNQGDFEMPEEVCFTSTLRQVEKTAEEYKDMVSLTDGSMFKLSELKENGGKDLFSTIDTDLWNDLCEDGKFSYKKAAEVLPTLPRPDAEILSRLAPELGINNLA